MSVLADQVYLLARRSVVRTLRQPANVIAPLVFPLLLLAVNSGGLKAETRLPGFPTDSFVAFALAIPFIQGALFATMNAGTDLARDIQTGFLNRLALTPMRGVALLGGELGGFAALRTGSGEAVQSLFPAFFVFLFLSSMNLPRNLIEIDWFRAVATVNPVSYLIECVRSLIIAGWDGEALGLGFGIAATIAVAALLLASWALRVRMERT